MKFKLKHEIVGRIRVSLDAKRLTFDEADVLEYYLTRLPELDSVKVYERTADVVLSFKPWYFKDASEYLNGRRKVLRALRKFDFTQETAPDYVFQSSGRRLNAEYKEKLVAALGKRLIMTSIMPAPIRIVITAFQSIRYIKEGIKCLAAGKLKVPVLDGIAIGTSMMRGNFNTAGSVMFLLGFGELLEEWTKKRSYGDLARSMALNISHVWLIKDDKELLVLADTIVPGDTVRVHMGNIIPFDGEVEAGDALVNQSSMTGESAPVHRRKGDTVYAGTVLEEGELIIKIREACGTNKYDKIISMIEASEKTKSISESKAEHLADRLVPYTLAGTIVTYLLTRNITKALAVLMVDFSCALKLAMPISVITAMKEAQKHEITVKGGKFFEAVAEADTVVFDKTGTLTKATPKVKDIISFGKMGFDEILKISACLEEHFPHSVAKAVVKEAAERGIVHDEMHSKVDYIVAHGIASFIGDKRVVIGSRHFIFEDEGCKLGRGMKRRFDNLPKEYSHLYLAIDSRLEAVLLIDDPLREDAADVIRALKHRGIKRIVMMTGDSRHTAEAIAARAGIDEFYSEVLPEDKAGYIEKEREKGHKVIMVGDGINDTPALSASNVGIAISDGAEITREIADIIINVDDMSKLTTLIDISHGLMKRISSNYKSIVGINGALIGLGVGGVIMPTTSALIHNGSTLAIGVKSMNDYLPPEHMLAGEHEQ